MKNRLILATITGCLSLPSFAENHVNFIIINLDDVGYGDFSYRGAFGYTTPNIDKMASEGMQFSHFLAAQPVSGASRAALLTGCYPNRIGFAGAPDHTYKTGISSSEETIAQVLKKKKYKTAIFGKWHLGHLKQFLPLNHGFDEYYGIPYSNDMWPHHPTKGSYYPDLPTIEGNDTIGYNTDQSKFTANFTDRTISFIKKNKKNPFFIYLAHPMAHVPLAVSAKFKGKSEQGFYGDVLMELDWNIGRIFKTISEQGIEENTLIILTSDNGPWINYGNHAGSTGGLREAKGTTFDGGNRVPCIMYWKGKIKSGTVCNIMTSNIDLLPTLAEISEAPLSKNKIDGVSLLPILKGDMKFQPHKFFFYYYNKNDLQAVTDGRFKMVFPHKHRTYTLYPPGNDGNPGKLGELVEENPSLYDLRRDPGERYNIINQYPDIVKKLESAAAGARKDLGDDLKGIKGENTRPIGTVK